MKREEFIRIMESVSPLSLQEEWDNSGFQIDSGFEEVSRVLVALDISSPVIEEAVSKNCDLIVTHHPLFFDPLKKIEAADPVGSYALRLIRAGISVYSVHTCFDNADGGINDYLMLKLGVTDPGCITGEDGSLLTARIGNLAEPVSFAELARRVSDVTGNDSMRLQGRRDKLIRTVSLCSGAGGEFVYAAHAAGADVFISGEIKHHQAVQAKDLGICLIEAGHYGTEQLFRENLAGQLRAKVPPHVTIIGSETETDPYTIR